MDGVEGSGIRLSKRFNGGKVTGGSLEVDYKTKSGTAWSHSFLNQKPWHPLSYPNQRRKWIAEQTNAQHDRRAEEVAREFAQEQEFFKQAALISKKEREKVEMMKAVSFMYIRPPGYDPESAKAAEYADETKQEGQGTSTQDPMAEENGDPRPAGQERKKPRPKDVFGRALPTEEEFDVLKNAPRMETGLPGRVKPFAVEVRNVKCLRCGNFGHQSGDRDCPLKDAVMPNEELRLKRDDPLTAIIAHTDPGEPLKWELKQMPGLSPPRGGFDPDDPNQQFVAEDIFDEYGGFLGDSIPIELLKSLTSDKKKNSKKNKSHKKHSSRTVEEPEESSTGSEDSREKRGSKKHKKLRKKSKKHYDSDSLSSEDSDSDSYRASRRRHNKHLDPAGKSKSEIYHQGNNQREKHYDEEEKYQKRKKKVDTPCASSEDSDYYGNHSSRKKRSEDDCKSHHREKRRQAHESDPVSERSRKHDNLESGKLYRVEKKQRHDERNHRYVEHEKRHRSDKKSRYDDVDSKRSYMSVKGKEKRVYDESDDPETFSDRYKSKQKEESDLEVDHRSRKKKQKNELSSDEKEESRKHRYSTNRRRN